MVTRDPEKHVSSSHNGEMPKAIDPDSQLREALAQSDWAQVEALLLSHGERLLLDGSRGLVLQALQMLPESQTQGSERLLCLYAWTHVFGQRYREARQCLAGAERRVARASLSEGLKASPEVQASLNALKMHLSALEEGGELPSDVSELMLPASTEHPIWQASALLTLARCRILSGAFEKAVDDLETARLLASTAGSRRARRVEAKALLALAYIARLQGQLPKAEGYLREVEPLRKAAQDPNVDASTHVRAGHVALLRGDDAGVRQALSALEELLSTETVEFDPIGVHLELGLLRAEFAFQQQQYIQAQRELSLLEESLAAWEMKWPLDLLAAERMRLGIHEADLPRAKRQWQQIQVRERKLNPPRNLLEAARMRSHAFVAQAAEAQDAALERARLLMTYAQETAQNPLQLEALLMVAQLEGSREALLQVLSLIQETGLWGLLRQEALRALASALEVEHPLLQSSEVAKAPEVESSEGENAADALLLN